MTSLILLEYHFFDFNGDVYCDRVITYEYLQRYLKVFEKIIVCGRFQNATNADNLVKVSGKNVEFLRLPNFVGLKEVFRNYKKIRKILSKNLTNFDCSIVRTPTVLSFSLFSILKRKYVFSEVVCDAEHLFSDKHKFYNFIAKIIQQNICKNSDGVAYVTNSVLQKKYPSNKNSICTSYSSIDLYHDDFFYRENYTFSDKFNISLFSYMDDRRKGQDILIKCVSNLKKEGLRINLNLIGDGKLLEEFKNEAYDLMSPVTFYGRVVDKVTKKEILQNTDLVVLPTKSEGLPRSLIEAMALSIPCLATDVDGIPEIINSDQLFKYGDWDRMESLIKQLYYDVELRKRIGHENYYKAQEFDNSKLSLKRNAFYKELKRKATR